MKIQTHKTTLSIFSVVWFILSFSVFAQGSEILLPAEKVQQKDNITALARTWALRLPEVDTIDYRGIVSFDSAGTGNGTMSYPAPNLAGFLAAVVTHGVLAESSKNSQKAELQKSADAFLIPYKDVLTAFRQSELVQHALEKTSIKGSKLLAFSDKAELVWIIEAKPIFFITPDENAILLDNAIAIYQAGTEPEKAFLIPVKVLSFSRKEAGLSSFWMPEKGAKIKEESAALYAQSLEIALNEFARPFNDIASVDKTIRYQQGGMEKMERGKLIDQRCNRMLIKTLRGTLMSVPLKTENLGLSDTGTCI
jgi:hypothetical protein